MDRQWAPAAVTSGAANDDYRNLKKSSRQPLLKSATLILNNVPFKAMKKEWEDIVNAYA
jgi:hypothetical protein